MAVTAFQSRLMKRLAESRRQRGESYVAGGVALNVLLAAPRRSRDIDIFHDTATALAASWAADRDLLSAEGCDVTVLRETSSFVEALVSCESERTLMQWARDSAYRFFPLVEHDLMGLALHPLDLATNKVLAMAGRLEPRDWVDVLECDKKLQPFGYLAWAACGKDPGYNPRSLLAAAGRLHYSQTEIATLDFGAGPPDAVLLGEHWHSALALAGEICGALPVERLGTCLLGADRELFRGKPEALKIALEQNALLFHSGSIGGAWPTFPQA